nr:energy-coupling factor transporter transmembrane protein EcfT [Corynebacterium crudilactis]
MTWIMGALSMWIVVLGVNDLRLSLAVVVLAQIVALLRVHNVAVLASTALLAIPVLVSMMLIHMPYSTDGWLVALALTARFSALMSVFLLAATAITIPELVKSLYRWPKLAYIVGSALQMVPQGKHTLATIRDANALRGRSTKGPVQAVKYVGLPLITHLLSAGASRAIPLEVAGLDRPGPRTVLVEVVEGRVEKHLRWLLPLSAIGVVLWL